MSDFFLEDKSPRLPRVKPNVPLEWNPNTPLKPPKHLWLFGGGGTFPKDLMNGENPLAAGTPPPSVGTAEGQALRFDGSTHYLESDVNTTFTADSTSVAYLKTPVTTDGMVMVNGFNEERLRLNEGVDVRLEYQPDSGALLAIGSPLNIVGRSVITAGGHDGVTVMVYCDHIYTETADATLPVGGGELTIGARGVVGDDHFEGDMYYAAKFPYLLTEAELNWLENHPFEIFREVTPDLIALSAEAGATTPKTLSHTALGTASLAMIVTHLVNP